MQWTLWLLGFHFTLLVWGSWLTLWFLICHFHSFTVLAWSSSLILWILGGQFTLETCDCFLWLNVVSCILNCVLWVSCYWFVGVGVCVCVPAVKIFLIGGMITDFHYYYCCDSMLWFSVTLQVFVCCDSMLWLTAVTACCDWLQWQHVVTDCCDSSCDWLLWQHVMTVVTGCCDCCDSVL